MPTSARSITSGSPASRAARVDITSAFRLSHDPQQRMRTLGEVGDRSPSRSEPYDAARVAFQIVVDSSASMHVRTNAILELMDLEAACGNRVAFERCRAAAEACASRMSPSTAVDYHYKLGIGLARFEQRGRAHEALSAALAMAESHRLNAWYFKIEQALGELTKASRAEASRSGRVTPERGTCDTANGSGAARVRRIRSLLVAALRRAYIPHVAGSPWLFAPMVSKDACGCSDGPVVSVRVQAVLRAAEASRVRTRAIGLRARHSRSFQER